MSDILAPVAVFCYKRKDKLEECLKSLAKCDLIEDTKVIIFSDGAKENDNPQKIKEVRDFIYEYINNCKEMHVKVIERESNLGLSKSIILGVTETIKEFGRIIVVEDDLVVGKDFLVYMNGALNYYASRNRYGEISAYTYPIKQLKKYKKDVYALRKGECWGWATWQDRWERVDWELSDFNDYLHDKKTRREFSRLEIGLEEQLIRQHENTLDAWAARWCFHLFKNGMLTIYPRESRVVNMGIDGSGTNCEVSRTDYNSRVADGINECVFEELEANTYFERKVSTYGVTAFSVLKYWIKKELSLLMC